MLNGLKKETQHHLPHTVTQPTATQPDDFVPPQLESGASKLGDICPEIMDHLRPVASFCSEEKLSLIIVLRTFVTNAKPRTGRSATDLLVGMVGKEAGPAGHRASRVAGVIRQMGTLAGHDRRDLFAFLFSGRGDCKVRGGRRFRRLGQHS